MNEQFVIMLKSYMQLLDLAINAVAIETDNAKETVGMLKKTNICYSSLCKIRGAIAEDWERLTYEIANERKKV